MKIRLERDILAEAVQWAARSLPTRPSVPILAGLLVRADADGVTLSSFDYETSARITVKADVTDTGEVLVSGRLLADISRSLPAKPVDLTAEGTRLELVCGSARFTLQTLPVADYPSLPTMPAATGAVPATSSPRRSPRSWSPPAATSCCRCSPAYGSRSRARPSRCWPPTGTGWRCGS